ncbi:nonstructural protein [Microvirus mar19]|uniref:Nonstructural protein n=1 Tax=Microvirus mar19 TaxID=2851151 RepID=A0A8F5RBY4_9VIRU|nr:nonstructural protein [Microvirus mar19]
MKLGIYVMNDKRSTYMTPSFDFNDACAIRNFEHALDNDQSLMFTHPEDFSIYKIGDYDNVSGVITPCNPVILADGVGTVIE